jgi:hypothetical protein
MKKGFKIACSKDDSIDFNRGMVVMCADCMPQIDKTEGLDEVKHSPLEWLSEEALKYQQQAQECIPFYENSNKVISHTYKHSHMQTPRTHA